MKSECLLDLRRRLKGKRPGKGHMGRWKGRRVSSQHTNKGFTFILSLIFYIIMSINLTCNAIIYIYIWYAIKV